MKKRNNSLISKRDIYIHGICQIAYTDEVFKDQILPKSAKISMSARLQQNSVNDC